MPPSAIYRLYAQCCWSCAPRSSVPPKRKYWTFALGLGAAIFTSFAGARLIQAASHAQEIGGALTAVWANTGEDKVTQEEIRSKSANPTLLNSAWDGHNVRLVRRPERNRCL